MRRVLLALFVALLSLLCAAGAWAAIGGLAQKSGTAGCVSQDGTAGACADGSALDGARSVTVSPDGENAYVTAFFGNAVAVFDRDPATGTLAQKTGTDACVSQTGDGGACADGNALSVPSSITVSPNGASAYVASSDGIAVLDRNPTTGVLTQKMGTAGCISETGSAGACTDGTALNGTASVAVSSDGASAYVASIASDAVAVFNRDPATGVLTQKTGTAGCISETGTAGACVDGSGLDGAASVTVSPDDGSVYVASGTGDAVAVLDRDQASGALAQKVGTAGCISETGSAGACADGVALDQPNAVQVSADGTSAYVASLTSDAVAIFDRDPGTGALVQKAGTAGCISETGSAGACADGVALDGASSVALTPDGASAYVTGVVAGSVSAFDRNPATGALTQKAGTAACVSETGGGGACVGGVALKVPQTVAVSPDGANAYVASQTSSAVAVFDRDLPPRTTIESGPDGPTNDATPAFGFSSSDAGSSFECSVDGGAFAACSGPGASHTTGALTDGAHEFAVRAIDPASNVDATPSTRAFAVDATAPETAITRRPKAKLKTRKRKAKVSVSFGSEAGATFECAVDGASFAPCTSPLVASLRSKGGKGRSHTISIRATDALGNVEANPPGIAFRVVRKR